MQGISDIITIPGLVNVDFADVETQSCSNSGTAMLGVGVCSGKNRAEEAAVAATSAPLIERSIERATGIVYNITGGKDLTLSEVNRVSEVVTSPRRPVGQRHLRCGDRRRVRGRDPCDDHRDRLRAERSRTTCSARPGPGAGRLVGARRRRCRRQRGRLPREVLDVNAGQSGGRLPTRRAVVHYP